MDEKPTAAFILSLIGAILVLATSLLIVALGGIVETFIPDRMHIGSFTALIMLFGVIGLVFGVLMLIGALMINSGVPSKVKTGSVIVIVSSVLSLLVGGGLIIGFILGLIGGILGLTWKPPTEQRPQTPVIQV
ncbi:MAG: hypothetical protein QXP80_01580 [Zestosphaera sp.]